MSKLTLGERYHISVLFAAGHSIRSITQELDWAPSTISRELKRNGMRVGRQRTHRAGTLGNRLHRRVASPRRTAVRARSLHASAHPGQALKRQTAAQVTSALVMVLSGRPLLTITSDNGKEFAGHRDIARLLNCSYYFADPYQPKQRGSVEYANRMVREWLSKGSDLTTVSPQEIRHIADQINDRPMQLHAWMSRRQEYNQRTGVALR